MADDKRDLGHEEDIATLLAQTEDTDVTLAGNPLWDDITPIPQNDGPHTVVNIAYTSLFRETMDFFRAVVASNERSPRVLALTKRVISVNAANYTAWHIRRQCLFDLKVDLTEEMEYVEECAENNSKNYQIWYHRRAMVEKTNNGLAEPQFVSSILSSTDAKNYHAWAHRQWAVKAFNLWEGELEYCDTMIRDDVRNNSAWSHRWFVLVRGGAVQELDRQVALREFHYLTEKAELAPSNECPYSYLRAITSKSSLKLGDDVVISWLQHLLDESTSSVINLRSILVDAWLCKRERDEDAAVNMCVELADRYDTIREKYWRWRIVNIQGGNE